MILALAVKRWQERLADWTADLCIVLLFLGICAGLGLWELGRGGDGQAGVHVVLSGGRE